jgi:hypothetical protein
MIVALPLTTVLLAYYRRVVLGEGWPVAAPASPDTAPTTPPPASSS